MKATILDVAKLAGVSPATVSRMINGKAVRKQTKERIEKAIDVLDYYPNVIARSFVQKTSYHLGVSVTSTSFTSIDQFYLIFLQGVINIAQEKGYSVTIVPSWDRVDELVEMFRKNLFDGIIMTNPVEDLGLYLKLLKYKIPIAVTGKVPDGLKIPTVDADSIEGAYLAANHLLTHGHKRIAYVNGPLNYFVCRDRLAGYKGALKKADVPYDPNLLVESEFTYEGGYKAVSELLERKVDFTGICAFNDAMACGIIKALKERGYSIPGDIAVVGFDNLPVGTLIEPKLTTVHSSITELGEEATKVLFNSLETPNDEKKVIPVELVVRESCGCKTN